MKLELERVRRDSLSHKEILYELLSQRIFSISHGQLPTKDSHADFVNNHPYRHWFLLKSKCSYIGTVYLTFENNMSIFLPESHYGLVGSIIQMLTEMHTPLEAVKSVRPASYQMNVPMGDRKLAATLDQIGYTKIQQTFLLNHQKTTSEQ